MLRIPSKLCCLLTDDAFDVFWRDCRFVSNVEVSNQVAECDGEFAFRPEQALLVELKLIDLEQEVLHDCLAALHALEDAVHVAGVAEVLQADLSLPRVLVEECLNVKLQAPFDLVLYFLRVAFSCLDINGVQETVSHMVSIAAKLRVPLAILGRCARAVVVTFILI